MYPPPGSHRYVPPKVNQIQSDHNINFELKKCVYFRLKNCLVSKAKFWKLLLLVSLVISTTYFSTVIIYPNGRESLFLIKVIIVNEGPF